MLLVFGLAAASGTIYVSSRMVRVDIPVMVAASVAMLMKSLDRRLGRVDGALAIAAGFVVSGAEQIADAAHGPDADRCRGSSASTPSEALHLGG